MLDTGAGESELRARLHLNATTARRLVGKRPWQFAAIVLYRAEMPGWALIESHPSRGSASSTPGPDVTATLHRAGAGHPDRKVTVTSGKVTVTSAARSKTRLQAGMCKGISDVRGYVGSYRQRVYVNAGILEERAVNDGKHPQHPGMCQRMKSLAAYVGDSGRDNWDF